jgi:hypothetical protein
MRLGHLIDATLATPNGQLATERGRPADSYRLENRMAVQTGPEARGSGLYEDEHGRGEGWLVFSAVLLLVLGTFNIVDGIAAIGKAHFYVADAHYVFGDLKAWGWTVLILGVAQLLIGGGIFARNQFARWAGVVVLSLNALAQLWMMPAYPLWSLAIFAIDILAIYGLVAYGHRIAD